MNECPNFKSINIIFSHSDMTHPTVAGRIVQAALEAADPKQAVERCLTYDGDTLTVAGQAITLAAEARVRVVGYGKAAAAMLRGVWQVLGERLDEALIVCKHAPEQALPERARVILGGHPLPDERSVAAGQEIEAFLSGSQPADLTLCLISGGGSALVAYPPDGVKLAHLRDLTQQMLGCGADIQEMNTVRKHLDRIKGGGLARLAAPSRMATLVLSDVIGSPLDVIASGPTVGDSTTYVDAIEILEKYKIYDTAPEPIRFYLQRGRRGMAEETVKPGDPLLSEAIHYVVASNALAAQASAQQARAEGYHTLVLTTSLQGEAGQAGRFLAAIARQIAETGDPIPRPACLIAGGETTVTLRGSGKGGRNQEVALGAVALLSGLERAALLTLGTDGEDGPTDAAGALATGQTAARAAAAGLKVNSYANANDSYHFFETLGDLLVTGPTGTNVNDLNFLFLD